MLELIVCSAILTAEFDHDKVHCGTVKTEQRIELVCDWMDAQAKTKGRIVTRCSIKRDVDEVKA